VNLFHWFLPLFQQEGDSGSGGTPPAGEPAGGGEGGGDRGRPEPTSGDRAPSPRADREGTPAGRPGGEERNYVPQARVDEMARNHAKTEKELRRQIETLRAGQDEFRQNMGRALGFGTEGDVNPEVLALRNEIIGLMPEGFQQLLERLPQLMQLVDSAPALEAGHAHMFQRQGAETLRAIDAAVAESYNLDLAKMNPSTRALGRQAFLNWVESDPRLIARYGNGDPNLVGEFSELFNAAIVAPARVSGGARELERRRPTPVGGSGTMLRGGGARAGAEPMSEDELHRAAFAALRAQAG